MAWLYDVSFGCGQDSKLPPSLQPVADRPACLLLSAWHGLCISFYTLLRRWGGYGVCISGGFEEEVGHFWGQSAKVTRPWIQSHLVLAFPSLSSPYTTQENLRPYLEEHSPTVECNFSKGSVVIILDSFKGHFYLWVSRSVTKVPSTFWWRKREHPKLVIYSKSWDKPGTKHLPAPKLAKVPSPLCSRGHPDTAPYPSICRG